MQAFVEWEARICHTEVFSASEKLDAQTIPNPWLSQIYSDFLLETVIAWEPKFGVSRSMKNSTLFAGLRLCMGYHFPLVIFAGETLWWCNSASQPLFPAGICGMCVWISNTSLVEHAGDTSQCATMNLCCCCCRMHLELFLLEWSLLLLE